MLIARKFIAINVIAYAIIILQDSQESPAVADIRRPVSVLVGFMHVVLRYVQTYRPI